ncbi:hypothetical protein KIN20_002930 [Parelaphostrongylus tenuis]|uniref:Uncharacterized protein n=1 Tax=Parelaphostrongylus tenuis TaxID=148309 RepID=A0AAD5LVY7_PARTN|nr:hypothetical protein KIN20_002930 [Parelaphostrongylus tenuis]
MDHIEHNIPNDLSRVDEPYLHDLLIKTQMPLQLQMKWAISQWTCTNLVNENENDGDDYIGY